MSQNEMFNAARFNIGNPYAYAGRVGAGPAGRTCRDCKHYRRVQFSKTYLKCGLVPPTRGPGTDIKARAPACEFFEEQP